MLKYIYCMTKENIRIKDAKKLRSGIYIKGEIESIGSSRTINLKSGGTIDVTDAILKDGIEDDDKIKLTLWGDDIQSVKVGSKVEIQNGYTNQFKGEISLTKGKFGTMLVS